MRSKKLVNSNGETTYIVLEKEGGSYNAFSPREAAEAIVALQLQLWTGTPKSKHFIGVNELWVYLNEEVISS